MAGPLRKLAQCLNRLRLAQGGAAVVEFALIMPLMLLLYIGSVEASALISMDRRVQSVAGAVGDLVARHNGSIDAVTLKDYFRASGGIMTPYPPAGLKQVVTQVKVEKNGTAKVVWSRQFINGVCGKGTDHAENTTFDLPQPMVDVARENHVIVAEASFSYLPMYGIIYQQPIQLHRENYFMPRFGGTITAAPCTGS
jgi:Flp pilus assembly protein TadG